MQSPVRPRTAITIFILVGSQIASIWLDDIPERVQNDTVRLDTLRNRSP